MTAGTKMRNIIFFGLRGAIGVVTGDKPMSKLILHKNMRCEKLIKESHSMMKKWLLLSSLLLPLLAISSRALSTIEGEFKIQGFSFQARIESKTDPDEGYPLIKTLHLSRKMGKTFQHLLQHTLFYEDGDHNSTVLELGDYEVQGDRIVFYSYWANAGDAPTSYSGVRKQVYQVSHKGRVTLKESQLYIDSGWRSEEYEASDHGGQYIDKKLNSPEQNLALQKYIRLIEKKFGGKFVFLEEAKHLIKEVKTKLETEIQKNTADWKKDSSFQSFGVRI